jgi:hypothetical protein
LNKKLIGVSSLAGIAGLVIGVGIGSGTSHTTIKTVAGPEKIVTKDVPVPGPTVTKDVRVPGPTKTVIKDVPAPAPSSASQSSPASGGAGDTVEFIAYGTCNPQITYGPEGSDSNGYVGMDVKMAIPASAPSYYAIQAQCQQGGSASVIIKVDGTQISSGVANGAYNIASAEISQDPISGQWQDDNTG